MRAQILHFMILISINVACNEPFGPAPSFGSMVPDSGNAGSLVKITGTNFGSNASEVSVIFGNGKKGKIVSITDTEITVKAPTESTSGGVTIKVNGQSVQTSTFTFYAVYAYGALKINNSGYTACFWKDGEGTMVLNNVYSSITQMVVDGSDTHIIGHESSGGVKAIYMKNLVRIPLQNSSYTWLRGIAVTGQDVHICGIDAFYSNNMKARYWKNGKAISGVAAGGRSGDS